jgi:D-galactarolactone cycloisomerase
MRARWVLWVCVEDVDGLIGWGEVWCNFPDSGAQHRCRLLQEVFAPLLSSLQGDHPVTLSAEVASRIRILRLQSAEYGPLDQCAAGLDTAIWDLQAQRLGQPLHRVLRAELIDQIKPDVSQAPRIRVYASGINPKGAGKTMQQAAQEGHRAFKVKLGFGYDQDLRTLQEVREIDGGAWLAADANQAWNRDEAIALMPHLAPFDLAWLEEPIAADATSEDWQALAAQAPMPLAAGENINHLSAFKVALRQWGLGVMQPDLAKWGGFTGCLEVVRQCRALDVLYCPHFLGGGIGLLSSAHLLAASDQAGLLEMDVNPNPLRTEILAGALVPKEGWVTLSDSPGLGQAHNMSAIKSWIHPLPS